MRQHRVGEARERGRRGDGHGHAHEHGHGRGRLRHGDVRAALLLALKEGAAHGYELGQRLERASGGSWKPSPGSIYPTLQALADEDLVTVEERDGKRIYTLTTRGEADAKARIARGDAAPWAQAFGGQSGELREAMHGLKVAAKQIDEAGTAEQREEAKVIVVDARRRIYELLAKG